MKNVVLAALTAVALLAGGRAGAQTFYGSHPGGFVPPGGDLSGYPGGFGYGVSPGSAPGWSSGGWYRYAPSYSARYALGSLYAGSAYGSPGYAGGRAASIRVRVPAGAELWFDGTKTRQSGAERSFRSPPLTPGKTYFYDVKARWTEGGKPVERTRTVDVRAGGRYTVDFTGRSS
jgi:uncharacterized protein (TIGR03000 family)